MKYEFHTNPEVNSRNIQLLSWSVEATNFLLLYIPITRV